MENTNRLSKSAQLVQEALLKRGFSTEVKELPSSTRTAKDAAASIGCQVEQIVKSLLFCSTQSNQAILILTSGINRVNEKAIEKIMGEAISKATPDFTREVTGFVIGGVPPIGHSQKIPHIFIDEELLKQESLWAAAGTPHAVFHLHSADLEKLTQGKIISIK